MTGINNILALVDLSANMQSVLDCALKFSGKFNSKIIVYHASPNTIGDEQVHDLRESIKSEINQINLDQVDESSVRIIIASEDFPGGELYENLITDADLIIAGGGRINSGNAKREKVVRVINESDSPVLVIPSEGNLGSLERILYCSSYEELSSVEPLQIVKFFASHYNSEVRVAHVKTHGGKPNQEHVENSRMEGAFFEPEVKYSYKLIKSDDVIDGISSYIRKKGDNDMVVMVRRNHHIFERIFGKNFTFRMLQHTEIPLLILKEPQLN